MKSNKYYQKNDKVLVKSYCGINVCVRLMKRYEVKNSESKLGTDGWECIVYKSADVIKMIKAGIPYRKNENPKVWVFDWQIIKKCR